MFLVVFIFLRLKGELHGVRERELSTIPPNKEIQELVLKQSEHQSLQEHKETLAFLRATRADTVESMRKSEAEFEQLKQINEEIKVRAVQFFFPLNFSCPLIKKYLTQPHLCNSSSGKALIPREGT